MESIVDFFSQVPPSTYEAIGTALGISVLLQGFKKWLQLQSPKVITFLLTALSFLATAIDYLSQSVASNPSLMGQRTMVIVGLTNILYHYIVKPTTNLVSDAKEYRLRKDRLAEGAIENQDLLVPTIAPNPDEPEAVEPVTPASITAQNDF